MLIRHYQPGDEATQALIYNAAAGALPRFKPATAEEVARRYRAADFDPSTRFYAVEDGETVGYSVFDTSGRVSYPWCLPGQERAQAPLLDAVLETMTNRGFVEAWAAYRADWTPVLDLLARHGFVLVREMVNFVADVGRLPRTPLPDGVALDRPSRDDPAELLALRRGAFSEGDPQALQRFYWENPLFGEDSLFALRDRRSGRVLAAGMLVVDDRYADPTKLDASMPCFRLGAFGTEQQRHKRVNGMFSVLVDAEEAGELLLAEAARRLKIAGLGQIAAQAPTDQPRLVALFDRFLDRQGSFPIVARSLGPAEAQRRSGAGVPASNG